MNQKQLNRMHSDQGFIAALDQSGGSTPKALKAYGINEDAYKNEEEMFDLVHAMRTRIITSPAFTGEGFATSPGFAVSPGFTGPGFLPRARSQRSKMPFINSAPRPPPRSSQPV